MVLGEHPRTENPRDLYGHPIGDLHATVGVRHADRTERRPAAHVERREQKTATVRIRRMNRGVEPDRDQPERKE